jgi:integrase/recombinase XerD
LTPRVQCQKMQHVRRFLLFHARDHTLRFIPHSATFPKTLGTYTPRLVSEAEMARLLATTSSLEPSPQNPLRAATFRMALILLFCCGLRRGELFRLRLSHFDPQQNLLRIEGTKFHKSRLVPLPISVARELRDFLALCRKKALPMEPERFLIWNRLCSQAPVRRACTAFNRTWWRLCLSAGVLDANGRPPRVHDLRHSAAVAALERWYAQGQDVQAKLQQLATYLGHLTAACTHHYLHLTSRLREAASERFHQHSARLFQKGGRI